MRTLNVSWGPKPDCADTRTNRDGRRNANGQTDTFAPLLAWVGALFFARGHMAENEPISQEERRSVRINYAHSLDEPLVFANHMLVQHSESEFFISFFQVPPPIVLGTDEERRQQVSQLSNVDAKSVARIVVSPERLPSFIAALAENYHSYSKRKVQADVADTPDAIAHE